MYYYLDERYYSRKRKGKGGKRNRGGQPQIPVEQPTVAPQPQINPRMADYFNGSGVSRYQQQEINPNSNDPYYPDFNFEYAQPGLNSESVLAKPQVNPGMADYFNGSGVSNHQQQVFNPYSNDPYYPDFDYEQQQQSNAENGGSVLAKPQMSENQRRVRDLYRSRQQIKKKDSRSIFSRVFNPNGATSEDMKIVSARPMGGNNADLTFLQPKNNLPENFNAGMIKGYSPNQTMTTAQLYNSGADINAIGRADINARNMREAMNLANQRGEEEMSMDANYRQNLAQEQVKKQEDFKNAMELANQRGSDEMSMDARQLQNGDKIKQNARRNKRKSALAKYGNNEGVRGSTVNQQVAGNLTYKKNQGSIMDNVRDLLSKDRLQGYLDKFNQVTGSNLTSGGLGKAALGLASAAGLYYGGKKLYDNWQNSRNHNDLSDYEAYNW